MATEVGHISGMLQATEDEKTPLTKQLDALTNQIIIIAGLALVASIAIGYFVRGQPFELLFLTAVAFAVAADPDRPARRRHVPARRSGRRSWPQPARS